MTTCATQMEQAGTVSPAYLRVVIDYAESIGIQMDTQLDAVGVDRALLEVPTSRVSASCYLGLLDKLEKLTGDPNVGLKAGARFQPRHYGEMGYVVMTAPTVRDAIVQGIRFEALANDIARTRLDEAGPTATLTWRSVRGPLTRHAYELHAATWNSFAKWLVGASALLQLVELPFPAPADSSEHARIFGCDVRFDAPRHAVHFPSDLLSTPSLQADGPMQRRMVEVAEAQLRLHIDRAASEIAQARAFIGAHLLDGQPMITSVAAHLRIPVRTLQRRLGAQGLSFSLLVDDLRREIALRALCDPGLSLAQLAMRLGFSEQSAFTHAFKRWTRMTPSEWRRSSMSPARTTSQPVQATEKTWSIHSFKRP